MKRATSTRSVGAPVGRVPAEMYAQVIRPERFGEPTKAFKVEKVPVPEIAPDEVLVCVMAAGVNYNNVWAALGVPIDVVKVHAKGGDDDRLPHRRQRRVGRRLQGRQRREEPEGRRRGRRPLRHLGSERPSGEVRHRPDVRPELPDLGLRDQLGKLRAVHQGAGASVPAGRLTHLDVGSSGRLHAGRRDRLPHADRVGHRDVRRTTSSWSGARPAALGSMAVQIAEGVRARSPSASCRATTSSSSPRSSAPRAASTARSSITGACCRIGRTPPRTTSGRPARARSGRRSGTSSVSAGVPRIVVEHPGEDTVPTSIFVCDTGGMVVICAGTTG